MVRLQSSLQYDASILDELLYGRYGFHLTAHVGRLSAETDRLASAFDARSTEAEALASALSLQLVGAQAAAASYRRQRWYYAVGGFVAGVGAGVAGDRLAIHR